MIFLLILLSTLLVASFAGLYYSVKKSIELIETLESINLQIDSSVEELDYLHKKIEKKSKLELFSDEPAIRELVEDIKQAKKVVMKISESLTGEKDEAENSENKFQKES